jgi:hypothetical protein
LYAILENHTNQETKLSMGFLNNLFGSEKMYEMLFDEHGKHQLGGDVPKDFEVPENEFKAGFQYLGFIDNSEDIFSWLPFKLNLIAPIYLDFDSVYLDYENQSAPKIIYPENTSGIGTAYDTIDKNSIVIYEAKKISFKEFVGVTEENEFDNIGFAGKPNWNQNNNIPVCPKTNKKMKFVCQLTSWSELKTKYTNVIAGDSYEEKLFQKMNFWDDGDLYIFMQPESKTVCCFIQNG